MSAKKDIRSQGKLKRQTAYEETRLEEMAKDNLRMMNQDDEAHKYYHALIIKKRFIQDMIITGFTQERTTSNWQRNCRGRQQKQLKRIN